VLARSRWERLRTDVELDVILTAEVPITSGYVYRAEGRNPLTPLLAVLRPGGRILRAPCLAFALRHPSAGTILIDSESRMRLIDFDSDGERHGAFAQTVDLLGDGSVRLISTPGHTFGHLSVLIRLTHVPSAWHPLRDASASARSSEHERR